MQELQAALQRAFEIAESIQDPRMSKVKLSIQQSAANAGLTDFAMELRGKIATGVSGKPGSRSLSRFGTTPPAAPVFAGPNLSAARTTAERAASDEQDTATQQREEESNADAAESIYTKIGNMSPSAIVNQYGESAIERMITAKGGDLAEVDGKKPNQKAAYLKSLCTPA